MAVRNVLGGHHLGTRVQPKITRKKAEAHPVYQNKRIQKNESLPAAACRTLPNFSLIPQVPLYDAYEISKISQADVWWNYASREEMLKFYGIAMEKSGKTLKSFSLKSLVEFIEKHLSFKSDGDMEPEDGLMYMEKHETIVFNTETNCVDYRRSASCHIGECFYEDITSGWYQSMKGLNKIEKLMRWKYMALLYKLTPIECIYNMNFNFFFKETSVDEYIQNLTDYLDMTDEDDLEENRKEFNTAKRYIKSKTYLRKVDLFEELLKMDKETLFDHVIGWLEKTRHKTTIPNVDNILEALKRIRIHQKEYEDLIPMSTNYGMAPMCQSLFSDHSDNDRSLGCIHLKTIELDLQNQHENTIDFDYSLLENIEYNPEDYLKDIGTIL